MEWTDRIRMWFCGGFPGAWRASPLSLGVGRLPSSDANAMERRRFLQCLLLGGAGAGAMFGWRCARNPDPHGEDTSEEAGTRLVYLAIRPLDRIRAISLSPRSPIGSPSVGGLRDERSAPGPVLLPFSAPISRRRMVVLSRCTPALGLIPSRSKPR
jgi:hypothetical protein